MELDEQEGTAGPGGWVHWGDSEPGWGRHKRASYGLAHSLSSAHSHSFSLNL